MSTDAINQSGALSSLAAQLGKSPSQQSPSSPDSAQSPQERVAHKLEKAQETAPSMDDLQGALEEVQQSLAPVARDLLFSLHEDTGKTVVKVVDTSTDEVIRQIPTEEMLAIAEALDKLKGLLIKQEV